MTVRTALRLVLSGVLSAAPLSTSFAGSDVCRIALGDWNWFIGGKVAFSEGGQARWTPAVATMAPATATWTCDETSGTYTVTWQNGFVDTLRVSADGSKISGKSSTGAAVTGWRARAAKAAAQQAPKIPAPSAEDQAAPKGRWIQKTDIPPQKGPKKFPGWDKLIQQHGGQ
jgi:hypothetical protein